MSRTQSSARPRRPNPLPSRAVEQSPNTPLSGEIWWAYCSVTAAVLEAAQAYSSVAPSESMRSDYMHYKDDDLKIRPVIVIEASNIRRTATVIPLATFGGCPINRLSKHFQRLAISVGDTVPWPTATSSTIQISPSWPKSKETPCYAIAHLATIPGIRILQRFTRKSDAGKTETFSVLAGELAKLAETITNCISVYDKATPAELHQWNSSWTPKTTAPWQPQREPAQSLPAFPARSEGPVHHRVQMLRPPRMQWEHAQARAVMPNIPPILESPIRGRFEKPNIRHGSETGLSATSIRAQDVNAAPIVNSPDVELTPKDGQFSVNASLATVAKVEHGAATDEEAGNTTDQSHASFGKSPVSPKFPLYSPSPPPSATLSPHAKSFVPKSMGGMARMRVALMSRLYTQTDVGHVVHSRRPIKPGVEHMIQSID